MENRKKIDDLFKSELGNYTETPPPAVWDALEKKLDRTPSRKPRSPLTWFGFFGALCVFVTISVLVAQHITANREVAANNTTANSNATKQYDAPIVNNTTDNTNAPTNTATEPNATTGKTPAVNTPQRYASSNGEPAVAPGNNKKMAGDPGGKNEKQEAGNNIKDKNTNKGKKNGKYTTAVINKKNRTNKITDQSAANEETVITKRPENVYNISSTVTQSPTENNVADNDKDTVKKERIVPPAPGQNSQLVKKDPPKHHKSRFDRFEAGIKGGYEQGRTNDAGKKALISPYLQFKVTPKLAIMLQSAIKYSTVSSRQIGDPTSYYKVNPDGAMQQATDSIEVVVVGTSDSLWMWNYTYTESHDSIVKTNHTGGKYVELEMPVLLKYYVAKDFSIYGGVNIVYSQLTGLTERTYTAADLTKSASGMSLGRVNTIPPPPEDITKLTYSGNPYSSYTGPQYPAPQGSTFRFGYMVGFSYEYEKRWLFDMLLQQTFIKPNIQGGFNTYTPLSAPYVRLTIGYKLIK